MSLLFNVLFRLVINIEKQRHCFANIALTRRIFVGKAMTLLFNVLFRLVMTSLVAQTVKRLSMMRETRVRSLGWEDPLEKEMAIHSSTIAWKIPWTEEPGRLQSMGSQRVRHD